MSFDANETGIATGKPIRLYLFERGVMKWRYCSADRDIEYAGAIWAHVSISDDGIRQTGEASADAIKVTAPANLDVAAQYKIVAPSADIMATIFDLHYGDILGRVRFMGQITDVNWPEQDRCEIGLSPEATDENGLRFVYQRNCPHSVYDRSCRVDRDLYRVSDVLTAVSAVSITANALSSKPDGYFSGGFIEWNIGGGELDRRGLDKHVGATVTLIGLAAGLNVGMTVAFFPGCAGTIAVCAEKFSNKENNGGIPHLPGKSPFDGDPIY